VLSHFLLKTGSTLLDPLFQIAANLFQLMVVAACPAPHDKQHDGRQRQQNNQHTAGEVGYVLPLGTTILVPERGKNVSMCEVGRQQEQ